MPKYFYILLCLSFLSINCYGQKIAHVNSFRNIDSDHYFRINYENDVFVSTDYNYTQGYNLEFVSPKLRKNPLNFLLIKLADANKKYGLSIEGIGFTPKDIASNDIQFGDRPFSSATVIKSFVITTNNEKRQLISSGISIGMIGQATLGEETQVAIHKLTNSDIPNGWTHQIRNDFILNYQLHYEKEIIGAKYIAFNQQAILKLGALFSNISIGCNLIVGKYISPYTATTISGKKPFQVYIFIQPLMHFIGYDANLQGGLLNSNSPYTIPVDQINRLTIQGNLGVVLKYDQFYLELSQVYLSEEFKGGGDAQWGSLRFGWVMK